MNNYNNGNSNGNSKKSKYLNKLDKKIYELKNVQNEIKKLKMAQNDSKNEMEKQFKIEKEAIKLLRKNVKKNYYSEIAYQNELLSEQSKRISSLLNKLANVKEKLNDKNVKEFKSFIKNVQVPKVIIKNVAQYQSYFRFSNDERPIFDKNLKKNGINKMEKVFGSIFNYNALPMIPQYCGIKFDKQSKMVSFEIYTENLNPQNVLQTQIELIWSNGVHTTNIFNGFKQKWSFKQDEIAFKGEILISLKGQMGWFPKYKKWFSLKN